MDFSLQHILGCGFFHLFINRYNPVPFFTSGRLQTFLICQWTPLPIPTAAMNCFPFQFVHGHIVALEMMRSYRCAIGISDMLIT